MYVCVCLVWNFCKTLLVNINWIERIDMKNKRTDLFLNNSLLISQFNSISDINFIL